MHHKLLSHICNIAALTCNASISFLAIKKEDHIEIIHRDGTIEKTTIERNILFQHTFEQANGYLIVENITNDILYNTDEIMRNYSNMNFFAGFKLVDKSDNIVGCLCIIDQQVKQLDEDSIKQLKALGNEAVELLSTKTEHEILGKKINELEKINSLYEQTNLVAKIGYWEVNYVTDKLFWSDTTKAIHGVNHQYIPDIESAIHFFKEGWSRNKITECVEEAFTNNKPFDEELQLITQSGEEIWVRAKGNAEFIDKQCKRLFGTFQNIDIYKKQQLKLVQSEIKYRSIIENSLTAFLLTKADGTILDANKTAEEMFGYSVIELCKLGRKGILDMDDPDLYKFLKARENTGKAQGALTGIRKNGNRFSLYVTSALFTDVTGEIRTSLSMIDTTEVKKAQEELRISREEFSTTFEYASIGMALVGSKGEWIRVNKSLCTMLGYSSEELLKKTFQDITYPDDLHIDLDYLTKLVNDEIESYQMEKRYFTKSGEMLWVNLSVSKVINTDGSVKHFISQIENIDNRKKAEDLLAFRNQRFKAIFNSSYQLIAFLTVEGIVLEVNETALHFAGIASNDILGKNYWDGPWWKKSTTTQAQLKDAVAAAAQGNFSQYEVEISGGNDAALVILFNLKPIVDDNNNVIAILSEGRPIQDIADARKALMFKNQELQEFSAIASHDLKEPLRMIRIFMQMLEKNYAPQLDDKAKKYITTAIDGADRMAILIDDLLIYSQVGSEQSKNEWVNTLSVVEEIIAFNKKVLLEKEIQFELSDLPNIYAVKTPIKMLFENLIGNALKYQNADTIPCIKISSKKINNHIRFAISDNGIGIAKQYVDQVFKLFKRLHSRTEYSGTGMGLAICKKIVENFGGEIWVESVEGEGSTFYFTLEALGTNIIS